MRIFLQSLPHSCSLLLLYMVLTAQFTTFTRRRRLGSYFYTTAFATSIPTAIKENISFIRGISEGGSSRTTGSSATSSKSFRLYDTANSDNNRIDGVKINGEGLKPPQPQPQRQQQRQRQENPQTGWNHNLPSSTSNFWKGPVDERTNKSYSANTSTSSESKEARTGWLHNSRSNNQNNDSSKSDTKSNTRVGNMKEESTVGTSTSNTARRRLEWAKLQQQRNHRIVAPPTFHPCGNDCVVVSTEHYISVPIFRGDEQTVEQMDVYFCIVETIPSETARQFFRTDLANQAWTPSQRATKYVEYSDMQNADDMILYLQGGPGFGAPTPSVSLGLGKGCGSWADAALHDIGYRRIVLMDQRGTGKSTPITKQSLQEKFPNLFLLDHNNDIDEYDDNVTELTTDNSIRNYMLTKPEIATKVQTAVDEVTEYLAQFRADNIILDAELIRDALMAPPTFDGDAIAAIPNNDPKPWGCSLGQSYGGFCQMTYLSMVDHPPRIMLFTGGIAPMLSDTIDVYEKLWYRVKERNLRYYEMYPGDIELVKVIVQKLLHQPVKLPSGGRLTARRFLSLGISLGGSPSSFSSLHELISSAFVGATLTVLDQQKANELTFSRSFLKQMEVQQSFDDHPIYYWLHESIYADGTIRSPTKWAADTAYKKLVDCDKSEFDYRYTSAVSSNDTPTLLFGEHVFPWMSEDFIELSGVGLRMVTHELASKSNWGRLYDEEKMKSTLHNERTRAAAAIYHDDMYVEFDACMKVTARDGPLAKCKVYVTNEYQHSGLRDGGSKLFTKLHGMAKGGTCTPS